MYNKQFHYCQNCLQRNTCPIYHEQMRQFNPLLDYHEFEPQDSYEEEYLTDYTRAPEQSITRIVQLINRQQPQLLTVLQGYGVNQNVANYYLRSVISYTLDNQDRYTGNINRKTISTFNDFRRSFNWIFAALRANGVPNNVVNDFFRDIIEFTLRNNITPPGPGPIPDRRWSQWEDLGGVLNSAPGVSSWAQNRLDTFVAGSDNALYHKYWNGSRWSEWENLGGSLTSAPAAVSWGPNRIDVFVKGTTNSMFHKYWNGSRWSEWEDLGGVLTSAPAVASWSTNRLDVFVRGSDNALYHKYWSGTQWSDWENLGGRLTSSPAAVSWSSNRIDVFGRGQGNRLYHKWWDGSRWSGWEDLGGNLASAPAVSSRSVNRLEVFAKNQSNQLITMTWNGSRWSNWQIVNNRGIITSDPSSVSWGPNRTDVFVRGTNNAMWHIWKD